MEGQVGTAQLRPPGKSHSYEIVAALRSSGSQAAYFAPRASSCSDASRRPSHEMRKPLDPFSGVME